MIIVTVALLIFLHYRINGHVFESDRVKAGGRGSIANTNILTWTEMSFLDSRITGEVKEAVAVDSTRSNFFRANYLRVQK